MKTGVIILSYFFEEYLNAVKDQFRDLAEVLLLQEDFKKTPQHELLNEGIEFFKGYDAVLICDADELYQRRDLEKLIALMDKDHGAIFVNVLNYVDKNLNKIYKPVNHRPVAIVDPKEAVFYDTRCIRPVSNPLIINTLYMHHLGYTFSEKDMEFKKAYYWDDKNKINDLVSSATLSIEVNQEIKGRLDKWVVQKKAVPEKKK